MRGFGASNRSRLVAALAASTLAGALYGGAGVAAADSPGSTAPAVVSPSPKPPAPPSPTAPAPFAPGTPDDSPTHAPARSQSDPAARNRPVSPLGRHVAPAPVALPVSLVLTDMPGGAHYGVTPTLNLRADGHGVRAVTNSGGATANGRIPPEVIAAAFTEAKSLATLDMGTPDDATGSTLLDFLGPSPSQDVHLIAYGSDTADTLSAAQKANRTRFAALRDKLTKAFVADR
ncbi:hypothetical protein [Nocardia alni]|uniref:hypothetical protein n=1 Tax=Nocardia alni TaxID=2815723 RepID=UPI001C2170A1|nr:hypothetical protein [Nocardia alni]